jgi:hypothetical protein
MQNILFFPYPVAEIAQIVKTGLELAQLIDPNSPANIAIRTRRLETLTAYEHKDQTGKPLPMPEPDLETIHALTDVLLSTDEALSLGVKGQIIPLPQLVKLAQAETTAAATYHAKYLLQTGKKDISRYKSALAQQRKIYAEALQAFKEMTKPPHIPNDKELRTIENGKSLLSYLEGIQQTSTSMVLLAKEEHSALKTGQFDIVDTENVFEQDKRLKINSYTQWQQNYIADVNQIKTPIKPIFNPRLLREIDRILYLDETAAWIFEALKTRNMPTILFEYQEGDQKISGRVILGNYGIQYTVEKVKGIEFLGVFTNQAYITDTATRLVHEARHAWQEDLVSQIDGMEDTPIDSIIRWMIMEADAQAVENKICWNLASNHNQRGIFHEIVARTPHLMERMEHSSILQKTFQFGQRIIDPVWQEMPQAKKISKVIQLEFISFLKAEFENIRTRNPSAYLETFIQHAFANKTAQGILGREIQDSKYLTDDFLTKLSQIGKETNYLDVEGTVQIRKIFDQLPQIIAKISPPDATPATPPAPT